jgi:hypothetical protein
LERCVGVRERFTGLIPLGLTGHDKTASLTKTDFFFLWLDVSADHLPTTTKFIFKKVSLPRIKSRSWQRQLDFCQFRQPSSS